MTRLPAWARRGRAAWVHDGSVRPPIAHPPGPGQESVRDYPRPPRVEADSRRVRVFAGKTPIADTRRAVRVLETASPPTFYLPPQDVDLGCLARAPGRSRCEWKGEAVYWTVHAADPGGPAAWSYPEPFPEFAELAGFVSFYPARLLCSVDGERVRPQPGGFYGGWITGELVGPFKGEPGSSDW